MEVSDVSRRFGSVRLHKGTVQSKHACVFVCVCLPQRPSQSEISISDETGLFENRIGDEPEDGTPGFVVSTSVYSVVALF